MANGGYNEERDGGFVGWWIRWMFVGILIAFGLFLGLVHVANVRVEKQKEYRAQCFMYGPRDSDGDAICDQGFMPSYTSAGPYFSPAAAAPSGS